MDIKTLSKIFVLSVFFLGSSLLVNADEANKPQEQPPSPWLTGSLIAPQDTVIEKGHFQIQPYLYTTVNTGVYDQHWHSHSTSNFYIINPQIVSFFGITEWMDFQITPQMHYNISQGKSSVHFGDLPIGFDFQLVGADVGKWIPGIKLSVVEIFPTGKYQKMNPEKMETDQSGQGSFASVINMVFYKLFHIIDHHFLSTTLSFAYTYSAPVHVKGFNVYGGGYETRGKVFPGNSFEGIFSFEYTLNQNWVFALDNVYMHTNNTRFTGSKGHAISGDEATVGSPSSEQISFAPAIEYNFSEHIGMIAGIWFTAFGRNSTEFRSGVVAVNFNY